MSQLLTAASKHVAQPCDVVLTGGIFKSSAMVEMMQAHLIHEFKIILPEFPPVFGAIIEAAKLADIAVEETFESNFRKGLQL